MGSREPREQPSLSSFVIRQSDGRNQQWAARGHLECSKGEAVSLPVTEGSSLRPQRFARVCVCVTRNLPTSPSTGDSKAGASFYETGYMLHASVPPLHRKMPYICVCMCCIPFYICRPQGFMKNYFSGCVCQCMVRVHPWRSGRVSHGPVRAVPVYLPDRSEMYPPAEVRERERLGSQAPRAGDESPLAKSRENMVQSPTLSLRCVSRDIWCG